MYRQCIALAILLTALQAVAQQTNELRPDFIQKPETNSVSTKQNQQRRIQFMKKMLNDLGITEEQQVQIVELQQKHAENIKANTERTKIAREKLSQLQTAGAPRAELAPAIDEISEAQKERLWILVDNQMEMERILGKEKYAAFMDLARNKYRTHGRRGGLGMPPRPEVPRMPGRHEQQPIPPGPEKRGPLPPPAL